MLGLDGDRGLLLLGCCHGLFRLVRSGEQQRSERQQATLQQRAAVASEQNVHSHVSSASLPTDFGAHQGAVANAPQHAPRVLRDPKILVGGASRPFITSFK